MSMKRLILRLFGLTMMEKIKMFDKFIIWCGTYKKPIGYFVGCFNIMAAAILYSRGMEMTPTVWISLILGAFILVDASRS